MIERTPDGKINNCAMANGDIEENCFICTGSCFDRAYPVEAERAAIAAFPASGPALAVVGPEFQDALVAWKGLTAEEREVFYTACVSAPNLFVANLAVRLLKVSTR